MLLIPMVSPEILSVMMPKALIYVPVKPVVPVEVEVQATRSSSAANTNTVAVVRPPVRPFQAPSVIRALATIIDPEGYAPPAFTIGNPNVGATSNDFTGPSVGVGLVPTAPPPKPPEPPKKEQQRFRVGGNVRAPEIIQRINPAYPPLAKQARISGLVKLEGIIAKDGTVQQLKVVSGHPLLAPAALEAVRQWRYRPTLLNGDPVEVIAPIDVNFILSN